MNLPSRRTGTLERPDCRIYYEVTGEGPALVFAHGLGGNHMSWFQQVAHFAPRFQCVTFAHRGFFPSSKIEGGPQPREYAADLAALVEHLQLRDICLVGQSMGGWTSVEYALAQPHTLKGLVLACTTGTIDPRQIGEPERSRLQSWMQNEFSKSPDLFRRGIHPAAGERMANEQPALHLLYRHIGDPNADIANVVAERLMAMRTRAPAELARLPFPILFISGSEDVVMPPFAGAAIAREVPRAKVVQFEMAGHSVYFERPQPFNAALDAFLAGL